MVLSCYDGVGCPDEECCVEGLGVEAKWCCRKLMFKGEQACESDANRESCC